MTEAQILADIMLSVGSRPDCRIWRSNTGTAKSKDGKRFVRFGLKGTSDILGLLKIERTAALESLERFVHLATTARLLEDIEVLRRALFPFGRLLAIEAKSETGRLTKEQRVFRGVVESFGGLYILARSEADAVNAVEAACRQ